MLAAAQDQPQVLFIPADRPGFVDRTALQGKDGTTVAHAVGLQLAQLVDQRQGNIIGPQFSVHGQLRDIIFFLHMGRRIVYQALAEVLDAVGLYGKSSRHGMAAVLNQQVVGILQGFVHIKAGNAPARALSDAVVNADDQRRPVILFYQPRRRNADNAGMPVLPVGDEHAVIPSLLRFNLPHRLPGDVVLYILPFLVQLVQLFSNAASLLLVGFQQKAHALFSVADAAGSVEARRRRKGDAAGAD